MLIKNFVTVALLSLTAFTFTPVTATAEAANVKTAKVVHKCAKQDTKENLLACAIYAESRNQGKRGMYAVGNVVLNRKGHDFFPDNIKDILFQRGQFSYQKKFNVTEAERWKEAKAIAKRLIYLDTHFPTLREAQDMTKGATFFKKVKTRAHWTKDMVLVYRYKEHQFYLPTRS